MAIQQTSPRAKYYLNRNGDFVIENYNFSKPLANFFPGIAGKYGIPMWAFYVNRAQGMISFGTKDKDHSYLEFFSANKAWQFVSTHGFRTFIKVKKAKSGIVYEPFHNSCANTAFDIHNKMSITSFDLRFEETNLSLGIKTNVEYFTIPNDSYAALVRKVTLKNISKKALCLEVLDGLPQVIPFGTSNLFLKKLGRTIEAWMQVQNLRHKVPFYKLSVDPIDRPEVVHVTEGNFYLGLHYSGATPLILPPIVNPESIFGRVSDFSYPYNFVVSKKFSLPKKEITASKTPCAFLYQELDLAYGQEKTFYAVAGYMRNLETLNANIPRIIAKGYLEQKREENRSLIKELQNDIATDSGSPEFNLYCAQTYLDNIIRGGYPATFLRPDIFGQDKLLPSEEKSGSVFYLYSRKHGDLERDYNKFQIQATYFSQGNGNYRDMNQNRRSDTWFNPALKDENTIEFFNLLQADGFNPLVIKGTSFTLKDKENFIKHLRGVIDEASLTKLAAFLARPFTPGDVILFIEDNAIKLSISYDRFLETLISCSVKNYEAEHGEGFWTDHWTYNLDLLESYLGIYPEHLLELVFTKRVFTFFDNSETVKPRAEKYLIYHDGSIKQLHALASDSAKKELIRKRSSQPHIMRADHGKGEIYKTTLINKLLCLCVNKLSSLDPFGTGIEMEADKPNWYDALNGLPALCGSSIHETFELKRLIEFILESLKITKVEKIHLSEEIYEFLFTLNDLLQENLNSNSAAKDYEYWDKSETLKEEYRKKVRFGFSGQEREMHYSQLTPFLSNALLKLESGIRKAKDPKKNVYYSYFINEVTAYEKLKTPFVKPTKFVQKNLPLFLEGQYHALKLAPDTASAKSLYRATKSSALFDKALKMYKVSASLKSMPEEIGRCRVFTPGWLEHESIWLHMEYKYLLELLKQGLHEEFYAEFKNLMVPFQKPSRYGRSILENVSFLVSSAFPDKNLHGNGFVARLSGSTAEFLSIWLLMNIGSRPFFLSDKEELNLRFSPILPGWLFSKKSNTYSFNFLGKIKVRYHNPQRKNTFGRNRASPNRITFKDKEGSPVAIASDTIAAPYAEQIRLRQISQIDIHLK